MPTYRQMERWKDGQTGGWTDKTKLVGAVGDSANAPKQQCLIHKRNLIRMLRHRHAFRTEDPDHADEFTGHCYRKECVIMYYNIL
jgi:hypothetical protein